MTDLSLIIAFFHCQMQIFPVNFGFVFCVLSYAGSTAMLAVILQCAVEVIRKVCKLD